MQKITKIGIISLGKLTGASGFLLGLIIGVLYGMAAILFGVIGGASGQADAGSMAAVGIIGGIFAMIGFPLIYGVMSFIGGLIYGVLLNFCFGIIGGLEVKIEGQTMDTFD